MDTFNYNEWEADRNNTALTDAQEYINDYNNGVRFITYRTNQTKQVLEYIFMKIFHILDGSGIFLDYKVFKRREKCIVELYLSERSMTVNIIMPE